MPEGLLPPLILELRAKASEVHAELKSVGNEVGELDEKTSGGLSKTQKGFATLAGAGKAVTFGLAGAAAAVGAFGIEAATTGSVADAKLETAIRNVGGSMEELDPKIKATDSRLRNLGFTNVDTNTALASLTTALHDPEQAMKDMSVAADLARLKNIPLAQSALLVAKASEGQTKPLKALGIDLPVYAGGAQNTALAQQALAKAQAAVNAILAKTPDAINPASKAHASYVKALATEQAAQAKLTAVQHSGDTIMAALTSRVHGQADAFGKTLPGKVAMAKAQLDNIGERVGAFLIPKLTALLGVVGHVVDWFGKHTTTAKILAGVLGGVLATVIAAYIASLVKAGYESVVNFAKMIGGWFGLSTAAETGAAATTAAATEIGVAEEGLAATSAEAGAAIDIGLGPIGLILAGIALAATLLMTHWSTVWNTIKTVASEVWDNALKPMFDAFKSVVTTLWTNVIQPVFGFITSHWGLLFATLTGGLSLLIQHWRDVWGAMKAVYNSVIQPVFAAIEWWWNLQMKVAEEAWNFLNDKVLSPIEAGFQGLLSVIQSVADSVAGIFTTFWDGLLNAGATVFNAVADAWNSTVGSLSFTVPSWVPFIGGDGFSMPQMPHISGYATGGAVSDGLFVAGEHGVEVGYKSGNNLRMFNDGQSSGMLAGGDGPQVIELHPVFQVDGQQFAGQVERIMLQKGARRGQTYQGYRR